MEAGYEIRAVAFDDDVVQIAYQHIPKDVRGRGAFVASHTITVSAQHPGWTDDIRELHETATAFLESLLEDFTEAPELHPDDLNDDDDDDERGMGE